MCIGKESMMGIKQQLPIPINFFFVVGHARHQNLIKKALPLLLLLLILCLLDPDVFLIGPKKKRKNLNIKCLCALNFVAG